MEPINLYRMRRLIWIMERLEHRMRRERENTIRTGYAYKLPKDKRNRSPVEESVVEMIDLENTLSKVAEKLTGMQKELDPMIDKLDDPEGRMIIRLRYIKNYAPEDISRIVSLPRRMIYYILGISENQLMQIFPDRIEMK